MKRIVSTAALTVSRSRIAGAPSPDHVTSGPISAPINHNHALTELRILCIALEPLRQIDVHEALPQIALRHVDPEVLADLGEACRLIEYVGCSEREPSCWCVSPITSCVRRGSNG